MLLGIAYFFVYFWLAKVRHKNEFLITCHL